MIQQTRKIRLSAQTVIFLIILLGVIKFSYQQTNILSYDYFGLYVYLPATFIYYDPAISDLSWLEQINATYKNTPMFYQLQLVGNYNIIRFFCGMAMLLSPFFFLGHVIALLTSYPADGFSYPYQLAMMIAAFFYVAVGLIFMRKVLLRYFSDKAVSISLLALFLGTNLLFWSTFDAGAPHTILFTLYAMLLWFTIRWHETPKAKFAAAVGLILGLIIVSRPSDIIAVLIPLMWNVYNWKSLKEKIKLIFIHYKQVLLLVALVALAGLPQMAYYFYYTGKIYLSTYTDPQSGFDFSHPRFGWVLFSFRKGWLIYAPLMAFALAGFIPLWRKHHQLIPALLLHFVINLFLIASFTSLISYGWRAFIQSYALLAFPLAAMVSVIIASKIWLRAIATLLLGFFIWLSALQGWQIIMEVIDGSRMTQTYYWEVFGKTTASEENKKLLRIDPYFDDHHNNQIPDTSIYKTKKLVFHNFNDDKNFTDPLDSLNRVFLLDSLNRFSPAFKKPHNEITDKEYFWARISFRYFTPYPIPTNDLLLVTTYTYQGKRTSSIGKPYKYRDFPMIENSPGKWHYFEIDYLSPEVTTKFDRFESYLWYRGQSTIYLDDFSIKIFY